MANKDANFVGIITLKDTALDQPGIVRLGPPPGNAGILIRGGAGWVFDRPKSRFFNPANVAKAETFFATHGAKTIVLARFVPIVRTFVPTVAGVSSMHYRTFVTYNLVGGVLWGAGVTTLGYFLGEVEVVKNNIEIAAVVIVAISLLPVALELYKHRKAAANKGD